MNDLFRGNLPDDHIFYVESLGDEDFLREVIELQKNEVWRNQEIVIAFVFAQESTCENFIQNFRDKFSNVDTAGGLVENEKGEYLMIYHRKRWSLPKGHVEWREDPELAAVREVKEETGISELELVEQMDNTYHTFKKGRKWIFKTTKWYKMRSHSSEELTPQEEEHISEIRWINPDNWPEVEPEAFPQVKHVMKKAFDR